MELPWSSWLLLVVPPVVLFAAAVVHWLRAPREPGEGGPSDVSPTDAPEP